MSRRNSGSERRDLLRRSSFWERETVTDLTEALAGRAGCGSTA